MDAHSLVRNHPSYNSRDFEHATEASQWHDSDPPMLPKTTGAQGGETYPSWGTGCYVQTIESYAGSHNTPRYDSRSVHPQLYQHPQSAVHYKKSSYSSYDYTHTPSYAPGWNDEYHIGYRTQPSTTVPPEIEAHGGVRIESASPIPVHTQPSYNGPAHCQPVIWQEPSAVRKKSWGTVPSRGAYSGLYSQVGLDPSPEDQNTWQEWNWGCNWKGAQNPDTRGPSPYDSPSSGVGSDFHPQTY
ncbi:hypothetical protein PQX77_020050 [Marasmius sp. AFHP31]|nr:hypothetical protein PQX77_020050 [Marasmius sp. AFHP31]